MRDDSIEKVKDVTKNIGHDLGDKLKEITPKITPKFHRRAKSEPNSTKIISDF